MIGGVGAARAVSVGAWVLVAAGFATVGGCGGPREEPPPEATAALPPGAVARVGDELIEEQTVRRIAAAQKITVAEAKSRAVFDALMAVGARKRGLAGDPAVIVETRGVLAEALLRTIREQAQKAPSTAEEVERVTTDHWLDLDRPQAVRTVHAVVRANETDEPQKVKAAREIAAKIAAAVKGVTNADRFIELADGVPHEGFELSAEKLAPVTADGRVADLEHRPEPGKAAQTYDKDFVAQAWRLKAPGDQTEPVRSSFGWHVIMLLEVQPALTYPPDKRESMLRDEIVSIRAREAFERALEAAKKSTPPRVERNAATLMDMVAGQSKER